MGLIDAWRNTAVREGFEHGRSLAEIAEETGLSEREVLYCEVELKLIPHFSAVLSDTLAGAECWKEARKADEASRTEAH
jgi:hypothetical protein